MPAQLFVILLLFLSFRSELTSSSTKQTTKITKTTRTTKTTETTVTIPHRCYRTIQTGSPVPGQIVPAYIASPPYVFSNGTELAPDYPLVKNHSEVVAINKSCSIAKSILDKLQTYIREGITTEKIDIYAHELILKRGAYPSHLHYNRYPNSITTSINNIVALGKPDDTKLRSGDIITVDISVYYKGYHGACADTFLVEKVDFAGQKLVTAAREVTYAGIKSCRPGESFRTLGRVIEQATKTRGYKVIPCIESRGIGKFFHEYPHILNFENNYTKSEEIMQPGMVFTIQPAITDGNTDCITLFENSDEYGDNWTVTTVDGSRTAQFERTVLITNDGNEVLGY